MPVKVPGSIVIWFWFLSCITDAILTVDSILSYSIAIKFSKFNAEKMPSNRKIQEELDNIILDIPPFEKANALTKYDIFSLRQIIFGGTTIRLNVHEKIIKAMSDISITMVYGMTETGVISCQKDTERIGSSGYICKNVRVIIADLETGKPLKFIVHSEICVKFSCIMNGYYKNPESTKGVFDKDDRLSHSHIKYSMDFMDKISKIKTRTNILFQRDFFELTSETAMTSPVSSIIANI
ncbi:PREDICTED: luciferin 4-monooxygenase-like [Dinoponera quadriceps]|uniref:Luciferin 4-monooxygenase-like n=1 Tax=Dinoponera quadriceps TaxID=609295 RepID=A0A6P3X571_DINQU|nr:PREDICTED: luciferin 4-monooxygenase-like [Dinoponera quadriceps]